MFSKEKLSKIVAEFFGTALLASVVLVVVHLFGTGTADWYTALSAGLALVYLVSVFGAVSGGHFNPAVTVGLLTMKKIPFTNAVVYMAAQLLGGAVALVFYQYATGADIADMSSAAFNWQAFWLELAGAALFGMGIAAAVLRNQDNDHNAFNIGLSLAIGALVASTASAGFLNPAVALANNAWNVTLVVAPVLGMVVGMNVYRMLMVPAGKKKR